MYQAINNYVIVKKITEEKVSDSGIILNKEEEKYQVVQTNEETKAVQNKFIKFVEGHTLSAGYYSVDCKNIIAVLD